MHCCNPVNRSTGRIFSRASAWQRRWYRWRGLERTQRQLLEGIRSTGLREARMLEVGSGVGYLHQLLLRQGIASHVLGVDLSEGMVEQARRLAREQGLQDRTEYRLGDFVELAAQLPAVDLTVLDKAVCCYPDAEAMIKGALERTGSVFALTYPRAHRLNRLGVRLLDGLLGLLRVAYRTYVHDPEQIEAWITARGFRKHLETCTPIWLTQVYTRAPIDPSSGAMGLRR
jgi:magnesium-protoporphyrin O-methyltransferase